MSVSNSHVAGRGTNNIPVKTPLAPPLNELQSFSGQQTKTKRELIGNYKYFVVKDIVAYSTSVSTPST